VKKIIAELKRGLSPEWAGRAIEKNILLLQEMLIMI
jgi:hypothetical protein